MKCIACKGIGLMLAVGLLTLVGAAQTPPQQNQAQPQQNQSSGSAASTTGSSLGDYARQIRKSATPEKPKVFDNDNLPTGDKLSIVGAAPPAEAPVDPKAQSDANAENKPAEAPKPAGPTSEENQAAKEALWKQWADKVKGQQDQIDLITRELNVLQREYQIRAAAMYGDAGNRLRNQGDWDKQDAQYKQQIADKQKALDDAKQKLEDMQEEARKAGVPSSYLGS
jgi:hypothetical protein